MNMSTDNLIILIAGIAGFAVLMQAVVLLCILIAIVKIAKTTRGKVDDLRTTVIPVLEQSRTLLESTNALISRVEPHFDAAAADLAEITSNARAHLSKLEQASDAIQQRAMRQAARIDGMATDVLDGIESASRSVTEAVRGPARRASAAIAAVKAFVQTFTAPRRPAHEETYAAHSHADQDHDIHV